MLRQVTATRWDFFEQLWTFDFTPWKNTLDSFEWDPFGHENQLTSSVRTDVSQENARCQIAPSTSPCHICFYLCSVFYFHRLKQKACIDDLQQINVLNLFQNDHFHEAPPPIFAMLLNICSFLLRLLEAKKKQQAGFRTHFSDARSDRPRLPKPSLLASESLPQLPSRNTIGGIEEATLQGNFPDLLPASRRLGFCGFFLGRRANSYRY